MGVVDRSSEQDPTSTAGRISRRWEGLTSRHGWRAYAVPLLTLVTIAVAAQPDGGHPRKPADRTTSAKRDSLSLAGTDPQSGEVLPQAGPIAIDLGGDGSACAANGYATLVLVSRSQQHLWVCQYQRQVLSTAVTTGRSIDNDQTPLGSWRVQGKATNRVLTGPGYADHVHFWVPFNGDFGLHDAPWQTMPFGSPDYRTLGSHGCVHVPTPIMATIYSWARVGHTVVTIEA